MKRALHRVSIGATALFAAAAFAAPAAFAAETTADLEVSIQGLTLAAGSPEKTATFTVTNKGPQTAAAVTFDLDISGLDDAKVQWTTDGIGCEDTSGAPDVLKDCIFRPLAAGESQDFGFTLTRVGAATGSAGSIKVTVKSAQDENTANNTVTGNVVLAAQSGVDLSVYALDIYQSTAEAPGFDEPVLPGATTFFWVGVSNYGTVATAGVKMGIKLPEGVTFVGNEPDCDYTTGSTSTTCSYIGGNQIDPGDADFYFFEVKVADTVAGPATLTGGLVEAADIPVTPEISAKAASAPSKKKVIKLGADQIKDVDPTDNSGAFNAHVGAKGGQGGGLPVTGTQVGLIAGVGLGAVIAGGALFLVSRRRRQTV